MHVDRVRDRRVNVVTGGSMDPVSSGVVLVTLLFIEFGVKDRP